MITLATPADASDIHRVMLAAFEEYKNSSVPSSALDEKMELIRTSLVEGEERAFVYWKNDRAVGTVRFKEQEAALYFFRLSVCPEERGRGIAGQLLQALEEYAITHNFGVLQCQVRLSVAKNITLYKNNGFYISKKRTVIKSDGKQVETALMTKKL
ncbi:GNAT family N-acetyltransferase [Terribacillus saccharophilus]|uniref:GNAT family N-acetyltransferase n=1 Tax=Terribacillus saccharophilus TaxID=361277 RepID=UPI002DC61BAA|nr:GNAT family N-acetyltransferase [Terribacillus saccharophilus]